ncbi:hypothetical protein MMC11_004408 [Xylographa trunciseda]|nr:hypothetical protein [Xylographa trunciseda]
MAGVPGRFHMQWDLFDALGLPPVGNIALRDVIRAWRRVKRHLHPHLQARNNGFVPEFPTYVQARDAYHYLTAHGMENAALEAERRIRWSLRTGRDAFRSTWNPGAEVGTPQVLQPIPGAVTLETAGLPPPLAVTEVGTGDLPAWPFGSIGGRQSRTTAGTGELRRRRTSPPAAGSSSQLPDPFGLHANPRVPGGTNQSGRRRTDPAHFRPPPPDPFTPAVVPPAQGGTNQPEDRRTEAAVSILPPTAPFILTASTKSGANTGRRRNTGTNPPAAKKVTRPPSAKTTAPPGTQNNPLSVNPPPRHAGGEAHRNLTFQALRAVSRDGRVVVGDVLVGSRHFAVEGHINRAGALNMHRVDHDVNGRNFRHAPGSSAVRFENVRLAGQFRACRNDRDMLKRWVARERRP